MNDKVRRIGLVNPEDKMAPVVRQFSELLSALRGEDGEDGEDGASAYQIAVVRGFAGTEAEWIASLRGSDGRPGAAGKQGAPGATGEDGLNGWTPILALVEDGERRVLQVTSWVGGGGPRPETGLFVGPGGFTPLISEATDLRGPPGKQGPSGGGGGLSAAQVIDLIEGNVAAEHTHHPFTATDPGTTEVLAPSSGKRLKIYWISAMSDPDDANAPLIKVLVGATEKYRGYAIQKGQLITGGVDEAVSIDLSGAANVSGTIIYDEV